ncbi:unnamed protein product [Kuraishia capsulata CBS 1993]|uniref:Major facilitator superfamily (MFS) profile domain-containing protein n=1 Tax=Kuraishia capsulata CBS 1993 TaxID=1382522 RepID=W6MSQ2_9ASCO|nr:uncharacterized protein KUCA_T00000777001 [Kuraishia capsulata CBS 1993]CDK24810.1 unnamed protein product [Kuraishia capsulata CBS 1993]
MKKHLGLSGNYLLGFLTAMNGLTMGWFGYDQGVFSGVLISADFISHFPKVKDSNISGITSSCFSLGAFLGAITAFSFGEKIGRKKTILCGSILNAIGAILQISAFHLPQMIIGRVINGFGMGLTSSTCPVYQAECTKAQYRGRLVVVGSLSNTFAYMLANWMNFGLYFSSGPLQWRFPMAFQLLFPMFSVPILLFLPESPRWLMNNKRFDEGLQNIALLWGKDLKSEDPLVQEEYYSILSIIDQESKNRVPLKDVLLCKDKTHNLKRVVLGMGTQFMQQFTGVNALGYYMPTILTTQLGFSSSRAKLLSACNATSYLAAAFVCLIIIDMVGRRRLMIWGSLSCCVCYIIAAVSVKVADTHLKFEMGCLTVTMFFLYYVCYGTSYAKVPWVYSSEINSIGWRTRGAAAATATNWICGFCVTQYTKKAIDNMKWGFYLLFACIVLCYVPVVYFLYPETSRRTLEDIDYMFQEYDVVIVSRYKVLTQRGRAEEFAINEEQRVQDVTHSKALGDEKSSLAEHVETI